MRDLRFRSLSKALLAVLGIVSVGCAAETNDPVNLEPEEHEAPVADDQSDDDWEPPPGDDDAEPTGDAGAGDDTPTPTPKTPCTKQTYRLRHLQASMLHTDPVPQLHQAIDAAFAANAHTISWTEVETAAQVQRIARRTEYETFWPSGKAEVAAKNAVPLSWRKDTFTFVKGRSWFASEGRAKVSPSRWVTRVWLTHRASGRIVSRVAHHSISGVDGAGKDPVQFRRDAHQKDIAKFREVMMLDTVPVIGSADFNTTRLRSMVGGAFAYDVPKDGGSHGGRLIDWVVRRPDAEQSFVGAEFVNLGPSDHRGVRSAYDYTPACK